MHMSRDDLYQVEKVEEDFVFNEKVAEVFDDMLDRSIPHYQEVIDMISQLLDRYLKPGDTIYDLGCATGNTLLALSRRLKERDLSFTGVDSSAAMIDKANRKAEMYSKSDTISFYQHDIMEVEVENVGAIVLNYTLQFVRPLLREEFVRKIFGFLRKGGVLIVSEKVVCADARLNREFIDLYHQFKKERGYSELEIAKKREALENVLIPFTGRENRDLLEKAGFREIEQFFQWFNFASYIAVK
jgi:tRNA (cmo5U34)-methyltransferase